tara:strand:+ start:591 stop:842 length:252 start_codon:yes stop_codon:yes gene_type:complete
MAKFDNCTIQWVEETPGVKSSIRIMDNSKVAPEPNCICVPVPIGVEVVVVDGINRLQPDSDGNTHYIDLQEWVAEGNTIAAAD